MEKRIEVHELDARDVVHLVSRHLLLEIFLHLAHGVRVAVSQRIAQNGAVAAYTYEIDTPSVYTNALYFYLPFGNKSQSIYNFIVKSEDVPVEVSSSLNEIIVEASKLFE